MKHKMIFEYLKTISFAIFTSVIISLIICYVVFFARKEVDADKPQYLINSIEHYVEITDGNVNVDEMALESLKKYNSWLQIIGSDGKVVYSKYVPSGIPSEYSYFDLVNYVIESNRIQGYTIFINDVSTANGYSILIGCDSDVVSKHSYQIEGNGEGIIFKCIWVFLIVSFCVIVLVAYLFAKKVTIPITNIIQDIDDISKGKYIETKETDNLFKSVFWQLQNLQKALEENENTRAIWISNISHDIKTPLSTIKGYAELMASDEYEFEKDEIMLYSKEIAKSEEVIEGLVDDLKVSQMLVEGKLKLNKSNINVYELIWESVELSKSSMKDEDIIEVDGNKDCKIFADAKLIKRSIVNIICNAFIHNEQPVKVGIMVEEKEDMVEIEIKDNGKGMEEQEIKHIFERYYRGTNSTRTKGTGLGLAIAKEAVVAHGGTIEVSNDVHGGTKFQIIFKKAMSN